MIRCIIDKELFNWLMCLK